GIERIAQPVYFSRDRTGGRRSGGGEPLEGVRVKKDRGRFCERKPVYDIAGFDGFSRARRLDLAQPSGQQRKTIAQHADERIELDAEMTFVQSALELIAEQRADGLTAAHALRKRNRGAHARGREIDRERLGLRRIGMRKIGLATPPRRGGLDERGRVDVPAVRGVLEYRTVCGI